MLLLPKRMLEFAVLVVGVGCAVTILWAGFQITDSPGLAGQLALDQARSDLEIWVQREWKNFQASPKVWTSAPAPDSFSESEVQRVSGQEAAPDPENFKDRDLFDALLRESRRLESAGADPAEIRARLDSAQTLNPGPGDLAVLRLRRLQLARRLNRPEEATALFEEMLQSAREQQRITGFDGELPAIWLAALAVAPLQEPAQAQQWGDELLGFVRSSKLIVESERGTTKLELAAPTRVLLDGLAAATGASIRSTEELLLRDRKLRLLHESLGQLQATQSVTLHAVKDDPKTLILLQEIDGKLQVQFTSADALLESFERRIQDNPALSGGFRTAVSGQELAGSQPLGEPISLGGSPLTLILAHSDPEAFIRQESHRQNFLRGALLVAGAALLLASGLAFVALARQRRLGELKTEFIAKVSHELRTPITGILLASEGLDPARKPSSERRERYLGLIQREARRLEYLVANVLDFSRIDRGAQRWLVPEKVEIADLMASLVAATEERLQAEGIALQVEMPDDIEGRARLDAEALRRATSNLVENAILHGKPKRIHFACRAKGKLEICIEDDGPGVRPADRETIFRAFRQATKRSKRTPHNGTGLGLAIVREIARGHGGEARLEVASSGRLARFVIALPLARSAPTTDTP